MNNVRERIRPAVGVPLTIAIGMVLALAVYAVARTSGAELDVGRGDELNTVGSLDVVIQSILGGLTASFVWWGLVRGGWARWWPPIGSAALATSMVGPSWFADGSTALWLMSMHFAVGIPLIVGLALLSPKPECPADPENTPTGAVPGTG